MFDFGIESESVIPFVHLAFMMVFGYVYCATQGEDSTNATEAVTDTEDESSDFAKKDKKTFKKLQTEYQKLKIDIAKFEDLQKRFADAVEKKNPISASSSRPQLA